MEEEKKVTVAMIKPDAVKAGYANEIVQKVNKHLKITYMSIVSISSFLL